MVRFNPDADSSINWQYAAAPIVAKKDFNSITVQIVYNYNVNSVSFDGIQLYKEEFGSSYTYDEKGNVISVKDLQGQTTNYEYTNNDLTKAILPTGAKMTYTYDAYHNVKTATTDMGIASSFNYDAYGNNTSVSILSGSQSITATASYTADGNRLASMSDAAGNVTRYSYNENTNVLEWVQYPEDTEATRTNYTYDELYRLTSATATGNTGTALTASYTYEDDLLTSVQTNSTTYSFAYGDFALRSSIAIGNRTLANYSYTSRNNFLSSLDYGNGDSVDYTYDKKGRLIGQTYEDGSTVTYQYDNSGALASVTDSASGTTSTQLYDFIGRLNVYKETNDDIDMSISYQYSTENNQVSRIRDTYNGHTRGITYAYDDDNRLTTFTHARATRTYTYDAFSRVSSYKTTFYKAADGTYYDTLKTSFTFISSDASATGSQVESIRQTGKNWDTRYTYTYDKNGNILSVTTEKATDATVGQDNPVWEAAGTTTYVYDSANQLIRENNQAGGFTYTWVYDNAGNILSRNAYAYTTGELGDAVSTDTYTYGDDSWGDLLTGYNGQTITYDTIGNPLSDGTWTYTWQHGRQLASITDGDTTWEYTYNADGLRTKKTNGADTYTYAYFGGQLRYMEVNGKPYYITYAPDGTAMGIVEDDVPYYFETNQQGDVVGILTYSGAKVVSYEYDAWGNVLSITGSRANTIGKTNPIRYRGYVYDNETGYYYLQSRYYNPQLGRFINTDAYASTGQGLLGNNMFTYCLNNPNIYKDSGGTDAILLYDSNFPGHVGALIQDEEGNWWHYYWGTSGKGRGWCIVIPVDSYTSCDLYTGGLTLEDINAHNLIGSGYEDMLYLEGDFSESVKYAKNSSGLYSLYFNNCTEKTFSILAKSDTRYKFNLSALSFQVLPVRAFEEMRLRVSMIETLESHATKGSAIRGGLVHKITKFFN